MNMMDCCVLGNKTLKMKNAVSYLKELKVYQVGVGEQENKPLEYSLVSDVIPDI